MDLRGTVYVTHPRGEGEAWRIERFVWTFEVLDSADFALAARNRSECIGAGVLVEFGPIGPSWNYSKRRSD